MNTYLKKWLSFLAATALLVTCTVSGLVLPVAAENMIVNGDLEADASQGWGGSAYVMDGVGVGGSRGIKIETTVNEGDAAVWPGPYYKGEFNAILEPNTTYVFSFDYKHEGKGFAKFDVTRGGTDWTGWGDVDLPDAADWTTYTIEFTTGAAENMNADTKWEWAPAQIHYANASSYGTGAAYYDNFSLVKKSDLPAGPENIPNQWMPNANFDAAESGWKDASKNAVPVQTDATGNKYISLSADGTVLTSPDAVGSVAAGDWVKVTFRARKNAPGKARLSMYWNGGMFTGYAAPYWSISSKETNAYGDGEWFTYTVYGQAKNAASKVYLQFFMVAANSTVGMDIDDVTVVNLGAVDESTLNLISGGSMDDKSQSINGVTYEGLFNDGGEIVAEGDNAVLKMTTNGQVYLYPSIHLSTEKKADIFKAERVYKLTYRQKGTGTTNPVIDTTRGVLLSIAGDPKVASEDWKTVTVYFRTTTSINPNYTIDFKTTGEVYLDDMTLYELPTATSLTVDKATLDMEIGDSETLTATVAPTGAYDVLTWSSNAESVATVDQNGKVTAVASGNAVITVTDGTLSATCVVTVGTPAPATGIELNKTELSLKVGLSETLIATTTPIGSPAEAIVWSVADATIATVDQSGKVTAVKEGVTTVTATSGTLTVTCTVTAVAKAKELSIPQGNVSVVPNGTITLSVNEAPKGGDVGTLTWTSSDTSVVTVDQTGKVTAVATTGSATVKVTNGELEASVTVTVSEYANLIPNGDLELGAAGTFHHLPSEGVSVEDGVGIDGSKALKLSKDRLNAVTYFKNLGHLKNYLEPNSRYVLSMKIKGAPMLLSYSTLTDVVSEDGKKSWYTTASEEWTELKVVLDTGAAPDFNSDWSFFVKHTTAVDADTYIDDITLTKQPQATGLVLSPSNVELLPDEGTTLKVTSVPANAAMGKLTFASSDPSIVSVDENGVVTAIADSGTVTITVTNDRGLSATATVTVNEYGNMIKNGDFESGTLNWTPPHGNIQEGVGKDGGWGHVIYSPTAGKVESTFYKGALPLLPGTTYEVSLDYLATKNCEFRLWTGTIGLKSFSVDGKKADGTMWEHKSVIFTTPTDMTLNPGWDLSIAVDAEGETPAVIDNVCLRLYNSGVEAESVKMNLETATIIPGRTVGLAVAATPVNGDVNRTTWKSSDENVATVEYGVVTGIGKGTATITATTKNGLTATCVVTVSGSEVYVTDGTFDGDNDAWTMTNVTLSDAIGVQDSKAASLTTGSVLSQTFKGLKPNTKYELFYRYRSAGGKATVTLKNGETTLLTNTSGNEQRWVKRVVEFTTGETLVDETVLTFEANGVVHIDNVLLAEKASLVDFVVDSVIWDNERQVKPGTEILFAATVINQGADAVPIGQTFTVEICKNGEAVQTITYTTDSPMDTGDAVIVMSAAPWVAEVGDHVISARVNNDLLMPELDTTNNTKQECLRVNDVILTAPDIAQQAGFDELTFSDEFDSIDTIDTMATSKDGYKWYVTRQWGATTVTRDAYDVKDGILTLHDPVPTYGITLTTVDVDTHVGYTWNKGYLEVRACIPTPRDEYGGGPTVWSFPVTKLYETPGENDHWVEVDWLEFWGTYEGRENGYWTISLHESIRDTSTHDTINSYTNSNAYVPAMGDKQWHTLGWLWDDNIIQGYIDGEMIFQQTYSEDGVPMPLPRVNEGTLEFGAFSFLNEQIMCLFLSGSTDVPFMVDYVHIWQGEGGGTVIPDGGDEPEIEEIDIPVETFWNNYCTDDWGDPIVTVNEENYSYILDGGRYWNALTEERRAEINAYLTENGQPTFDELLAAAKRLEAGEDPYPEDAQPTPDTGEHTALPAAMVALMVGAVALSATRKKRREK